MSTSLRNDARMGLMCGFESWEHLARFCVTIVLGVSLLVVSSLVVFRNFPAGSQVRMSFNQMGSTEIYFGGVLKNALVQVPSNKLWVNTGLRVESGQTIQIHSTGRINLGIHRLVEAANQDVRPKLPWLGPEGGDYGGNSPLYVRRKKLLVEFDAPLGCLLGYIRPEGGFDPDKDSPRPSGIFMVGKEVAYTYSDKDNRIGTLFLTVNDNVLSVADSNAYVAPQQELDSNYGVGRHSSLGLSMKWNELRADQYWDLWFDDNVGQFLAQISYM